MASPAASIPDVVDVVANKNPNSEAKPNTPAEDITENAINNRPIIHAKLVPTVSASSSATKRVGAAPGGGDGHQDNVLTVLGGKASCRRKFVLSVQLVDAQRRLLPHDLAITASIAFAHDHSPVRPPESGEPPLFTTFNGVEFSAHDNPTRMLGGRATFKLAISLLSSKFENRLFCICFTPQAQPPLVCSPCYSSPIRSISRKRTTNAQLNPNSGVPTQGEHRTGSAHCISPNFLHLPRISTPTGINLMQYECRHASHSPDHSSSENNRRGCGTDHRHVRQAMVTRDQHHEADEPTPNYQLPPLCSRSSTCTQPPASAIAEFHEHNIGLAQMILRPTSTTCTSTTNSIAAFNRLNTPSPVDSDSPNSVTFTSESCVDHSQINAGRSTYDVMRDNEAYMNCCSSVNGLMGARPLSAPSPPVSCPARPVRPQASIGVCKFPFGSNHVRISTSADTMAADMQSGNFVLGAIQQLSTAASLAAPVRQRLDTIMRTVMLNGLISRRNHDQINAEDDHGGISSSSGESGTTSSLEEEERAIRYLELSLYEVSRELQKRKEEVRLKRRRLLEEEARLHNLIYQSSSWINSFSSSKLTH